MCAPDPSCEEKIPIAHVHILSARLSPNTLKRDGQYFVRVTYNEIVVGKTACAVTEEKANTLSWDQEISVSLPIESIRVANDGFSSRHPHLSGQSRAAQDNAEVTFANTDSLVIEVYGTWVEQESIGNHHDKGYLAAPMTETDNIFPDLLLDPSRIFLPSSLATRQRSSFAHRRRTASGSKSNPSQHDEEILGYCIVCPTVLRELAEEGELVELYLWNVNRRNWKPIGMLRVCISLFRLQVRIVGAEGIPPPPLDSTMMLSVKWRGGKLLSRPLMWTKGFCIKPDINGKLAIIIHSGLPSDSVPPRHVHFRFDSTMFLSSFDAEGLVDTLNNRSKAAYVGTMELHDLGFEFEWDKKMHRFALHNKLGMSFTLLGKESSMATKLLGFHASNYVSKSCSTVLRTTGPSSTGGLMFPHCDELRCGTAAHKTMILSSVFADEPPLPLMTPEWNEIVLGPSLLDIASSGGALDVDVHLEPFTFHQSSLPLMPRGAGEAIASALFRRRPTQCIIGRATMNLREVCARANGSEQQLSLFPLTRGTNKNGGEVWDNKSSLLLENEGDEPTRMLPSNVKYLPGISTCNNEEETRPSIGAVRVAVKFGDQSQILKSVLKKWTCFRDKRIHQQLIQSMVDSKVQGRKYMMISPFSTSWVDIVDAIQMLCLLTYSIIMMLRAYHVARCSEDWACVAAKDYQLSIAESWQNYLDTTMTWLAVAHVCIKFRTGYLEPNGTVVMDPGKVARRYLQSSFILDALCCLPHDILSRLSGQEWMYDIEGMSKSDPGTPLARLVFALSRRLRWPALNRILKQQNFVRLDLLIQDVLVLRDGIVGIIRGKRVVLYKGMGLPIPNMSKMARFKLVVRKSRWWIHRTFEYKLLFYAKFAGGFLRGIKLIYIAFFRFLRMVRLARVAMVAVRSYTRKDRYSSLDAKHRLKRCAQNRMAATLTSGIANRRRRERGGGNIQCALQVEDSEMSTPDTTNSSSTPILE
eukprot:232227_1